MSPGIQWQQRSATTSSSQSAPTWHALADFTRSALNGASKPYGSNVVLGADLRMIEQSRDRVSFLIRYALEGDGARTVEEQYTISAEGVEYLTRLPGRDAAERTRFCFPLLLSDGAHDTNVKIETNRMTIECAGGALQCQVISPLNVPLKIDGPRVPCHSGWMRAVG